MNASLTLAAQTLRRVAAARQLYVLGTKRPLAQIDHVLSNAVLDAQNAYAALGGNDIDDILRVADADARNLLR